LIFATGRVFIADTFFYFGVSTAWAIECLTAFGRVHIAGGTTGEVCSLHAILIPSGATAIIILIADAIDDFWEVASGVVLGDTAGIVETITVQTTEILSAIDADVVPCGRAAVAVEFTDAVLNGCIATTGCGCGDAAGLRSRTIRVTILVGLADAEAVPAGGTAISVLTADAFFYAVVSASCAVVGDTAVSL
jgi:hypothetical protein